jgi:hypothetical protein
MPSQRPVSSQPPFAQPAQPTLPRRRPPVPESTTPRSSSGSQLEPDVPSYAPGGYNPPPPPPLDQNEDEQMRKAIELSLAESQSSGASMRSPSGRRTSGKGLFSR